MKSALSQNGVSPCIMAAGSSTGSKHAVNEDNWYLSADSGLAVVADGMSVQRGDLASSIAVKTVQEYLSSSDFSADAPGILISQAIHAANFTVFRFASANPPLLGMGTTLIAALIRANQLYLAHVGDSPGLLITSQSVCRLTQDHTKRLQDSQRTILARSVGIQHEVKVDCLERILQPDEMLVLCTDGLTQFIDEEEIHRVFRKHRAWSELPTATLYQKIIRDLIGSARARGSDDDITIVVAGQNKP